MNKYNAEAGTISSEWLAIPEADRLDMVIAYHRRHPMPLPNRRLHAVIHVIVENQLALGETVVVEALERLQQEGLSRHDAIHAIGMVLAEHLHDAMNTVGEPTPALHAPYFERLKHLSADEWRQSG